jgi:hypothetical protein
LHWHQLTDATVLQVMHLLRDTGTGLLAVGGAMLSIMALHCRWTHNTMRVAYTDKSPLCAVSAVAILAGHPKDFSKQCFMGRLQVPVPREHVEALRPGIFALREQLQQQYQHAPNKASVDHSPMSLVDTLIALAEAQLRVLPFRLQQFSGTYALLQLPQVRHILASRTWPSFQQQVLDSHSKVEQQGGWSSRGCPHGPCLFPTWRAGWISLSTAWAIWQRPSVSSRAACRQGQRSRCPCSSRQQQQALLQHSRHRQPQQGLLSAHLAAARSRWCRWCQRCTAARSRRWMMLSG